MNANETQLCAHSQRMTEEFPVTRKLSKCECCGQKAVMFAKLNWRAIYHSAGTLISTAIGLLMLIGGHGHFTHKQISFFTHHSFCSRCFWRIRIKKSLGELIGYFSFVLLLLSGGLVVGMGAFGVVIFMNRPASQEIWRFTLIIGGGIVGVVAGILLTLKSPYWVVPPALHPIALKPFQLHTVSKL